MSSTSRETLKKDLESLKTADKSNLESEWNAS